MRIATWNVNAVRAREARLLRWLGAHGPAVLCLQELKAVEHQFPRDRVVEAGYHAVVAGQKGFNGVALLSRSEPRDVRVGLGDGEEEDEQARLVGAEVDGVLVYSAYFPNGQTVGSDAYRYKLDWIRRLRAHLEARADAPKPVVLAGDFNVAPRDSDVANPERWAESVLCHGAARDALETLRQWGFSDCFAKHHPEGGVYSWWDYQRLAFPKNDGLRIDHVFATAPLFDRCTAAWIDRDERKGKKTDKPSDHAPVVAEFDL